jgi:phenylacetate-CoA ligase
LIAGRWADGAMILEKTARRMTAHLGALWDGNRHLLRYKREFLSIAFEDTEIANERSFHKLQAILRHAYATSRYYQRAWQGIGFHPDDCRSFDDLRGLPFLTKDVIERNREEITSSACSSDDLEVSYTGGTTGRQVAFYRDRRCTSLRIGRQLGILELCGYRSGDKRGLIWGVHEEVQNHAKNLGLKGRIRKFAGGTEALCCAVMGEEKMLDFHSRLQRFKPDVLYGYPRAIAQYADFIVGRGLRPISVKTIICTAERLSESIRALLASVFDGEVFNLYCTREHGCIGFECGKHHGLHIDTGSVHVEIVADGRPVKQGEVGQIVVTDYCNFGMPFIRNRIGDIGRLSLERCGCGILLPMLQSLDGRETDTLYRPDGAAVAGLMLTDLFWEKPEIKAFQLVQESLHKINLLVVAAGGYNDEVERAAVSEIRQFLGNGIAINVQKVAEIPRSPNSGKYREVICKIESQAKTATKRTGDL